MSYINNTRDYITASKLKCFMMSPAIYHLVYEKLPEDIAEKFEESKGAFSLGTMAHQLLEQFGTEDITVSQIVENFMNENGYTIANLYLKTELKKKILEREEQNGADPVDIKAIGKVLSKSSTTLEMLRERWYGPRKYGKMQKQIHLTRGEAEKLIIGKSGDVNITDSILKSSLANPIRDMGGKYDYEERISATYKKLTLGAKPDRIVFWSENAPNDRISLVQMFNEMKGLTREEKIAKAKEKKYRCRIRDFKTAGDVHKLVNDLQWKGDSEYGYLFSLSFYYTIIYINFGIKADVKLDIVKSIEPFTSIVYTIPKSQLEGKIKTIEKAMDDLTKCREENKWGTVTTYEIMQDKNLERYYPVIAQHMEHEEMHHELATY